MALTSSCRKSSGLRAGGGSGQPDSFLSRASSPGGASALVLFSSMPSVIMMWLSSLLLLAVGLSSQLSRACPSRFSAHAQVASFFPSFWPSCRAGSSGCPGLLHQPTLWRSSQPYLRPPPRGLMCSLFLSRLYVSRASVSSSFLYSLDFRLEFAFYLGPVPACGAPCPVVQFVLHIRW